MIVMPIIKAIDHSPRLRTNRMNYGYRLEEMYDRHPISHNKVALCVLSFEMSYKMDTHREGRHNEHLSIYYDIDQGEYA